MNQAIFREYDIRGKVGDELVLDQVYNLAQAIGYYFHLKKPQTKTIVVGMDGRIHSPKIKNELCKALQESGFNIVFIGICPSPALYFALHILPVDAGLMITASHNPKDYNGIKICLGTDAIWGDQIREIRALFESRKSLNNSVMGSYQEHAIIPDYLVYLESHFKHLKDMPLKAVIDCGNGAAGTVLPNLIKNMGWQHIQLLYADVDGTYPNHEADPVVEHNMIDVKQKLMTTDATIGIGLDGDCDRMAAMTKTGYLVPGDQMLALFAQQLIQEHPQAAVVFDIKSSAGLIELLESWQAKACMSPSGHAIIKDRMKQEKALLGGELSCHFFFHDRYFGYDDGIYAMLRLFELITQSKKSLEELLTIFPKKISTKEFRLVCQEEHKKMIIEQVKKVFARRPDVAMITIDGIRAQMPYGWGIVRASNTQSMVCLRFEADTSEGLQRVKKDFIMALHPVFMIQEKDLLE